MPDIEGLLNRWQLAGVLEPESADRIRAYEADAAAGAPAGLHWQGRVALILGGLLLACGVVLFVSAHWDQIGPGQRLSIVIAALSTFHLAGAYTRARFHALSTTLHAVGTVSTGAAIALVGQIFNIEEHWPGAILLWAIAAVAGWMLLHDEMQEALSLLLVPSWIFAEFAYFTERHIGQTVYLGRFLFVWAVLYLTVFLGSRHKVVKGTLLAAGAVAAVTGIVSMLDAWQSWSADQTFVPLSVRFWGWSVIAALPIFISIFRFRKSSVPVFAAVVFSIALPLLCRRWTEIINHGTYSAPYTRTAPNLAAHALVAGFAIFIIWWGFRQASRALVNLGMAGFAISVGWFYFSNIFDKVGRSLGLIGLGVLFLAGGAMLEKTRRSLIARMDQTTTIADPAVENAQ